MADDQGANDGQGQERFLLTVPALEYLRRLKPMDEVPHGDAVLLGLEEAASHAFPLQRFNTGTSYYAASITAQVAAKYPVVSDKLVMAVKLDDLLLSSVGGVQFEQGLAGRRLKELADKGIITVTQGYVPVSDIDTVLRDYVAAAFGEEREYEEKVIGIGDARNSLNEGKEEQDQPPQWFVDKITKYFVEKRQKLVMLVYGIARGRENAEDVVQDAYVRAIRYHQKYKESGKLDWWIAVMVRNLAINKYRKEKRQKEIWREAKENEVGFASVSPDSRHPSPETALLMREQGNAMDALCIAIGNVQLTKKQERMVLLQAQGMTQKEIATALSIPVGTVMSGLFRAKNKIRDGGR